MRSQEAGAWIIQFVDSEMLDELSIARIGQELQDMVDRMKRPKMVLDFVNVAHMSSSALGMLIVLSKRCRPRTARCACAIFARPSVKCLRSPS